VRGGGGGEKRKEKAPLPTVPLRRFASSSNESRERGEKSRKEKKRRGKGERGGEEEIVGPFVIVPGADLRADEEGEGEETKRKKEQEKGGVTGRLEGLFQADYYAGVVWDGRKRNEGGGGKKKKKKHVALYISPDHAVSQKGKKI